MGTETNDRGHWFVDQKEVYLQILDALADMVLVKGSNSRIAWANKAFRDYYGMSNAQLHDIVDAHFNEVDNTAQYVRDDLHVFTTGQVLNIPEEPVTRHDGLEQIFHTVKSPIRDAEGQVRMTVGVSRNITEQKRIKEDLARHREHLEYLVGERTAELASLSERLQIILASLGEGIVAVDAEGRVRMLNHAAETFIACPAEEVQGRLVADLLAIEEEVPAGAPTPGPVHERLLRPGQIIVGRLRARDGAERLVSITSASLTAPKGSRQGSVLVLRDISLEREVEAQRLRRQKLETVGLLAGGIAHDFNNILTGILGGISVARLQFQAGEDPLAVLDEAEHACKSAQRLTTQLLTFAKGGTPLKRVMQLEGPVRKSAELALRGSSCNLAMQVPSKLWTVDADEGQLEQVINNLVLNAQQAMPDGGRVTIVIENETISETGQLPLPPGRYVSVAVQDKGTGIDPALLPRIFDPYFTTKETGNGLGLASVHSIIRRHGGHVTAASTPGAGSRFVIYLPAAAQGAVPAQAKSRTATAPTARKLLILDDDARVRGVLAAMLKGLGQNVTVTGTSAEAFAAFQTAQGDGSPFDGAIVDLTMPGDLGGAAVVVRLREFDPAIRIVVMSGYSVEPTMSQHRELGLAGTLQKPFTMGDLRALLDCL
jgi:two-component system, cell cycle sensor histidine kinase and response regulator CckA